MKTLFSVAVSMAVGAALGGAAVQGLHAQATQKAYLVTESEVLDATALAEYLPQVREAARAAGGRLEFIGPSEKITAIVGDAPKRIAITEWDSAEKVRAWFNSAERKALTSQREKAQKITRQFIIEP
jgi:uncharacterized protein (DUF1330 family)